MPKVMRTPPRTDSSGHTIPRSERVISSITRMQMMAAIITRRPISWPI